MAAATLEAGVYEPPPREPEIGDKMPDGTLCAGVSPNTGRATYATPADAPSRIRSKKPKNTRRIWTRTATKTGAYRRKMI
jgi:hypothetical protein